MLGKNKFDWNYLLLVPVMAVTFIPWMKWHFHFRHMLPLMALWLASALSAERRLKLPPAGRGCLRGSLLAFVAFSCLSLPHLLLEKGRGMAYTEVVDLVMTLFLLLVFHFSICNGRLRELRLLLIYCFLCLSVSAAMTILGESAYEGGSRALTGAAGSRVDEDLIMDAVQAGIGGYTQVYGFGLLVFPVLYAIRFMPLPLKVVFASIAVLFMVAVYVATYTICLIGMMLALLLFLIAKTVKVRTLKTVGVVALILLVSAVANPGIVRFGKRTMIAISNAVTRTEYKERIESMADAAEGDTAAYASTRASLYWESLRTFLRHPVLGVGNATDHEVAAHDRVTGHSMVFDLLGTYGLCGAALFILFLVNHYRYLQVVSVAILGFEWWPSYYILLFSAGGIAFINPLRSYWIYSDFLLLVPALAVCFKRPWMEGRAT